MRLTRPATREEDVDEAEATWANWLGGEGGCQQTRSGGAQEEGDVTNTAGPGQWDRPMTRRGEAQPMRGYNKSASHQATTLPGGWNGAYTCTCMYPIGLGGAGDDATGAG